MGVGGVMGVGFSVSGGVVLSILVGVGVGEG